MQILIVAGRIFKGNEMKMKIRRIGDIITNVSAVLALWVLSCITIGLVGKLAWLLISFGWRLV